MSSVFRRFRITRKVPESTLITSFYFSPCDNEPIWSALPGQYLTLRIPTSERTLLKTYSISNDVTSTDELRITVKRETAPSDTPTAPEGRGSTWLHDTATVGTEIEIAPAHGNFVLDQQSLRPVVLLSGGVGQTPLLSMLHTLTSSQRQVWYVHACKDLESHAMHREVESLVNSASGRIAYRVCCRTLPETDAHADQFYVNDVIDKSFLQSLLPLDDYDCYVCGPTSFMVSMYRVLVELGIPDNRIAYEFFGKSQSLASLASGPATSGADSANDNSSSSRQSTALANAPSALSSLAHLINPDARAIADDVTQLNDRSLSQDIFLDRSLLSQSKPLKNTYEVVFEKSGIKATWNDTSASLLELAEQAGLFPDFSCRSGICNSCMCNIKEGEVEYYEEPLERPKEGKVLICCSRPQGRVVLDL